LSEENIHEVRQTVSTCIIRAALSLTTAIFLWGPAAAEPEPAAEQPKPFFQLQDLGHGVWAALSGPEGAAGSNSGFVIGSDAVLVIDSFADPAAAQALLGAIHEKTSLPVRYVVNTHYHLDHVAGNGIYEAAGAVILAQANVRGWERTENLKFFGDKITAQEADMVRSLTLPSVVYRTGVDVYLGDRKVVVRVLAGHTGGDSIVFVPDADVVFTGDMFWNHTLPNLIDADTRAQIASNATFVADYPHAVFVPGHGATGTAPDVAAFAKYLERLRTLVARAQTHRDSGKMLVDAVVPSLKNGYGDWQYFDYFVQHNVEQTADELRHAKRVPVPTP
jgi:glyoxylase-like metal-dependent hydrolase (beta-lactamase superfamily II)